MIGLTTNLELCLTYTGTVVYFDYLTAATSIERVKMLKFSKANTKLKSLANVPSLALYLGKRKVYSLDLLSGWTCPFAKDCLSKVHARDDGSKFVKDGPDTLFRCFSASQEALYPSLYALRKHNTDALLALKDSAEKMCALLQASLPVNIGICRIHVGGDFFNPLYFDAWVQLSYDNPTVLFYAYTKSLPFYLNWELDTLPDNLVITASRGGRCDTLIDKHNLREAIVVFDEATAWNADLEIDHDDSHAADPSKKDQSFALLIHGPQPKGSKAGKAKRALKWKGAYGPLTSDKKVGAK